MVISHSYVSLPEGSFWFTSVGILSFLHLCTIGTLDVFLGVWFLYISLARSDYQCSSYRRDIYIYILNNKHRPTNIENIDLLVFVGSMSDHFSSDAEACLVLCFHHVFYPLWQNRVSIKNVIIKNVCCVHIDCLLTQMELLACSHSVLVIILINALTYTCTLFRRCVHSHVGEPLAKRSASWSGLWRNSFASIVFEPSDAETLWNIGIFRALPW